MMEQIVFPRLFREIIYNGPTPYPGSYLKTLYVVNKPGTEAPIFIRGIDQPIDYDKIDTRRVIARIDKKKDILSLQFTSDAPTIKNYMALLLTAMDLRSEYNEPFTMKYMPKEGLTAFIKTSDETKKNLNKVYELLAIKYQQTNFTDPLPTSFCFTADIDQTTLDNVEEELGWEKGEDKKHWEKAPDLINSMAELLVMDQKIRYVAS